MRWEDDFTITHYHLYMGDDIMASDDIIGLDDVISLDELISSFY
jgi:hypothetical protein